jgi:hypothetical protein
MTSLGTPILCAVCDTGDGFDAMCVESRWQILRGVTGRDNRWMLILHRDEQGFEWM